jgi:Ca-activated chloride channel family protein
MLKRQSLLPLLILGTLFTVPPWLRAQADDSNVTVFHVSVNLVQLDVAVMDKKGYHITGLSPFDFRVYEDGILQKIATFAEESQAPRKVEDFKPVKARPTVARPSPPLDAAAPPDQATSPTYGAKVFILFDTSNYMYRGFVFAQDAISQFVRTLDHPDRVAYYTYSRNFFRACSLTPDRSVLLRTVRATVAGDDAALYDSLLWTLKDAARFSGKRVIVVFSNGPDNASVVSPEDVRDLAQSEGIPIYMISTRKAEQDPLSTAIFKRVSSTTGGKAYFAKNWQAQQKAFASVREDLAHLYTLSYYPQPNPNRGWRNITVKLVGKDLQGYHIRTRTGYRPKLIRAAPPVSPAALDQAPAASPSDRR